MKLRKLHHAVLRVRDLDRSVAFYRDVLGFREVARIPDAMAFLSLGDSHHDLALQALGMSAPPPEERRGGLYHPAFEGDTPGGPPQARPRPRGGRCLFGPRGSRRVEGALPEGAPPHPVRAPLD